jgi:pyroglutamyl-peptidase
MGKLRILVTGFGPFPGAPYNPTIPLVERLMRLRRPLFDDVKLFSHIFHVSYAAVDRDLPKVLEKRRPHALLMFGLAQRTPFLRVETRARNAITTIWPDADGTHVRKGSIARHSDALTFGPHTAKLLRAALATGVEARASRDADGPHLASFIHIPLLARNGAAKPGRITLEELVDAGEAMLAELIRLTRSAIREAD